MKLTPEQQREVNLANCTAIIRVTGIAEKYGMDPETAARMMQDFLDVLQGEAVAQPKGIIGIPS